MVEVEQSGKRDKEEASLLETKGGHWTGLGRALRMGMDIRLELGCCREPRVESCSGGC